MKESLDRLLASEGHMQVQTAADQLYFVTTRLECFDGAHVSGGTGFFYTVRVEDPSKPDDPGGEAIFLVTNRHVVECAKDRMLVRLIGQTEAQPPAPALGQETGIDLRQVEQGLTFHPDPNVDIAVTPFWSSLRLLVGLPSLGQWGRTSC